METKFNLPEKDFSRRADLIERWGISGETFDHYVDHQRVLRLASLGSISRYDRGHRCINLSVLSDSQRNAVLAEVKTIPCDDPSTLADIEPSLLKLTPEPLPQYLYHLTGFRFYYYESLGADDPFDRACSRIFQNFLGEPFLLIFPPSETSKHSETVIGAYSMDDIVPREERDRFEQGIEIGCRTNLVKGGCVDAGDDELLAYLIERQDRDIRSMPKLLEAKNLRQLFMEEKAQHPKLAETAVRELVRGRLSADNFNDPPAEGTIRKKIDSLNGAEKALKSRG